MSLINKWIALKQKRQIAKMCRAVTGRQMNLLGVSFVEVLQVDGNKFWKLANRKDLYNIRTMHMGFWEKIKNYESH